MHEQAENGGPDVRISEQGGSARWIIIGIAAICAVVFVLQNSEKVTIHFLFIEVSARVWVGAGAAVGEAAHEPVEPVGPAEQDDLPEQVRPALGEDPRRERAHDPPKGTGFTVSSQGG